jgi:hypothetical protein
MLKIIHVLYYEDNMTSNRTTTATTNEDSLLKKHWDTLANEKLDYFDNLVSYGFKSLPEEETNYVEHIKLAEFKEIMLKKILKKSKEKESTYSVNRYKEKIPKDRQQKKKKVILAFFDHLDYNDAVGVEKNRIMELQYRVCKLELILRDLNVEVESLTSILDQKYTDDELQKYIATFSSIFYITTRSFTKHFRSLKQSTKDILLKHAELTGGAASLYMQKSGHPDEQFLPDILRNPLLIYDDAKLQGLFYLIIGLLELPVDYDELKETESIYKRLESINKNADFHNFQSQFAALRNDIFKAVFQSRDKTLFPTKNYAGTPDDKRSIVAAPALSTSFFHRSSAPSTSPATPAATTAAAASQPLPLALAAEDTYAKPTEDYIKTFSGKDKHSEIIQEFTLNEDDKKELDKLSDPITYNIIDIPVRFNDNVYDLESLKNLPKTNGKRQDPLTNYQFELRDLQPARDIAENIRAFLKKLTDASMPAPVGGPKLK